MASSRPRRGAALDAERRIGDALAAAAATAAAESGASHRHAAAQARTKRKPSDEHEEKEEEEEEGDEGPKSQSPAVAAAAAADAAADGSTGASRKRGRVEKERPKKSRSKSKARGKDTRPGRSCRSMCAGEEEADVVMADVESIVDEKEEDGTMYYLCRWMDGAEPQWVAGEDLADTEALEEWENLEEQVPEVEEPPAVVSAKCAKLVQWLKDSKRSCWLLGAGISASVFPTFRGRNGLWTTGRDKAYDGRPDLSKDALPAPTRSHRLMVALEKAGHVNFVASQNYDDLMLRAGFPEDKLGELHGNIYIEVCERCGHSYHRDFDVVDYDAEDHHTGRKCDQMLGSSGGARPPRVCGGNLKDNIVHFSEALPHHALTMSNAKFLGADLSIAVGSSLKVEPAAGLAFKAKRRRRKDVSTGAPLCKSVIINLQPTPYDEEADLVIHADISTVMDTIARALLPDGGKSV